MSLKALIPCLRCMIMSILLLLFQPVTGQTDFSALDKLLEKNKKALGNSAVTLIWKDGKIVYKKELGSFDSKTSVPLASASKWLTAAVIMSLVDEGKLSLDDRIGKYLPMFKKYMKGFITLRNCLTHTTGLQGDKAGVMKVLQKNKFESLEAEVNDYAVKREIISNPNIEFYYSEVGINIAGRMAEVATKKSFDRLAMEKIIRPLRMRGTTYYTGGGSGGVDPSGGAQGSANDYLNFLTMLINKGKFEDKQVLSEAAVEELLKVQLVELPVKYIPRTMERNRFSLGAWVLKEDAKKQASVIASPSFTGSVPFIDRCRNYACIILLKSNERELPQSLFDQIKAAIDEQVGGNCD